MSDSITKYYEMYDDYKELCYHSGVPRKAVNDDWRAHEEQLLKEKMGKELYEAGKKRQHKS